MARRIKIDMDPDNTNAIRYSNGAEGASFTLAQTTPGDSLARVVTITGEEATDHSAKTVTLVGTDADGKAQSDTFFLPNGTATVISNKHFLTLTSATPSATTGTDGMDIGIGDDIVSKAIPLNSRSDTGALAGVNVTGTIGFDIEVTLDPPNNPNEFTWTDQGTPIWFNASNFAAKTAATLGLLDAGAYAARFRINTYTDTAEIQGWITDNAGTG